MFAPLVVASLSLLLSAQSAQATSCNATSPCPASAPCCSEFGFCGSDDFCLGGCNPLASNTLTSCKPNPICQDATYTFKDNSRILSNATYFDGNASAYDWTLDKGNIMNTNSSGGELALLLTEANGGTRISSTRYVHYGTISATLKTGRWPGVVTAFITMSNVKDEIDWEFPGDQTTTGQTNYFWQGFIPAPSVGEVETGLTDTYSNYHTYTIDWQPKTLTFSIDGKSVRSVNAADLNAGGVSRYPNTPSRIQLSLWPAGISSSAPGTVNWSGGYIDWNNPDYKAAGGHFATLIQKVTVKCGDSAGKNITSYVYGANTTANTPGVTFSNASTMLNGAMSGVPLNMRGMLLITAVTLVGAIMGTVV